MDEWLKPTVLYGYNYLSMLWSYCFNYMLVKEATGHCLPYFLVKKFPDDGFEYFFQQAFLISSANIESGAKCFSFSLPTDSFKEAPFTNLH